MIGILLISLQLSAQNSSQTNNKFAFDLYKNLSSGKGNIFVSPYSVFSALAMTAEGAQGKTLTEMQNVLGLNKTSSSDYLGIAKSMESNKNFELVVANRVWGKVAGDYTPSFVKKLKQSYDSDFITLDFVKKAEPSRITINKWVESKTKEKIKDLIPQGSINEATELILTNAIYFKAKWSNVFESDQTKVGDFTLADKKIVKTPLMRQSAHFSYFENSKMKMLEMPYENSGISMVAILPNQQTKLADLEKELNGDEILENLVKKSGYHSVVVVFPKFRTEGTYEMNAALKKLGIKDAFNPQKANFGGIRKVNASNNLFISRVIHKTFVDVNEEGTEAAAATAVMALGSGAPQQPKEFFANQPFMYFIIHKASSTILFIGRYSQPK